VNSLPKTVTRQRRGCDLNRGPSAPECSTLTTRLPSHPLSCDISCVNRGPVSAVVTRGVSAGDRFRRICFKFCSHAYWGNFILVCILISSSVLAAEDPLSARSPRNQVPAGPLLYHSIHAQRICPVHQ